MNIEKIMSRQVVSVAPDTSLRIIRQTFGRTHFHHILVVESGKIFGIISDRDLLKALPPNIDLPSATDKDKATLNKKAHQIMSRHLHTVKEGADILDAIRLFIDEDISCLPVVNEEMSPVGILSWKDILRLVDKASRKKQPLG